MKNNLLVTYFFPPAIGGIENYYYNFCRLLPPEEISVLANVRWQSELFDQQQKYKISRTDFFAGRIPPRWRPLKMVIKKVVQSENIGQILFGHFHPFCLLGRKLDRPFYIFGHGTDIRQIKNSWWQKRALRLAYRHKNFKKFIANSQFIADEVKQIVGDNSKIAIVYPGIDYAGLTKVSPDFAGKKKLLGLDDNDIIMLSMGRIEPEKNYEAVIRLMPEMLRQIPQLKYVIVGDGSNLEHLKALAENSGLKYQVIFTEAISNNDIETKAFYYQLGHIFITASLKPEGFGISYIEAQATSNAVIASKFGGSSEAIKNEETGLLVDPKSSEEIKQAIYKLALNRDLWDKMTTAGRQWSQAFDWPKKMEELKKILS